MSCGASILACVPAIWQDLELGAPKIARLGMDRINTAHVVLLGTLRADTSPRISPVEPYFVQGQLLVGAMTSHTGTDVPLLHLRLVVLTDRNCVSACDAFSGAVKDLRLGTLVGTRTSGILSGPAPGYQLDDGSVLALPAKHASGADHELIDGIGVAPDYYLPLTARDLSTGYDPDITEALTLLGR